MKNIVLIITDTFRYDNLSVPNGLPTRTPYLDRFIAERGVSIQKCYTGSFPTIPHRTDITTGRIGWPCYPWQSLNQSGKNHSASMLADAGYLTQIICDCPHLFRLNFNRHFQGAMHVRGQEGDVFMLRTNYEIKTYAPLDKTRPKPLFKGHPLGDLHRWHNNYPDNECDLFTARTSQYAIKFLEDNYKTLPFFMWVDFFDPHEPWDPPEYMIRKYQPEYSGDQMIYPNYGRSSAFTPDELENMCAHYYAEAELADRAIGRILEKIDDLGLWDDTIVCITSDHGTSLGDHGRTGKSSVQKDDTLYWPLTTDLSHVPLLLGGGDVPKGGVRDFIVNPADVLPTLLELAGVDADHPEPFHGRSFASPLKNAGQSHRAYTVGNRHESSFLTLPSLSGMKNPRMARRGDSNNTPFIITERWGLAPIGEHGRPQLYDLSADSRCEHDVYDDERATAKDLLDLFFEQMKEADAKPESLDFWQDALQAAMKIGD